MPSPQGITLEAKESLLRALEANDPETETAIFDLTPLSAVEIARLINAVKTNSHVLVLSLLSCDLTQDNVSLLCRAIQENLTLEKVTLEVFDDYPEGLKKEITDMQQHLEENVEVKAAVRMSFGR